MSHFFDWMRMLYVYCTDFIINLANLSGLAYYEINFIIFCLLFPLLTLFLGVLYGVQCWRLRSIRNERF